MPMNAYREVYPSPGAAAAAFRTREIREKKRYSLSNARTYFLVAKHIDNRSRLASRGRVQRVCLSGPRMRRHAVGANRAGPVPYRSSPWGSSASLPMQVWVWGRRGRADRAMSPYTNGSSRVVLCPARCATRGALPQTDVATVQSSPMAVESRSILWADCKTAQSSRRTSQDWLRCGQSLRLSPHRVCERDGKDRFVIVGVLSSVACGGAGAQHAAEGISWLLPTRMMRVGEMITPAGTPGSSQRRTVGRRRPGMAGV